MIKRVVSVAISDIIICCHSNDNREEITNHVIHEIYIHIFGCFTFTFREKKHHNISFKIIINLPNIFLCYHSNNNSEKKQSCSTFNLHCTFFGSSNLLKSFIINEDLNEDISYKFEDIIIIVFKMRTNRFMRLRLVEGE